MLIDWFTVGAQAVNFLILIWLMKRFLFGPITAAIQERQKSISDTLAETASTKREAEEERNQFQNERARLDKKRDELMKEAVAAAEAERKRLITEARKDAETLSEQRLEALRTQESQLRESLQKRVQEEALALARDVLQELAGEKLQARIVEVFLERFEELDKSGREALFEAIEEGRKEILVRSAQEFPAELREVLESGLDRWLTGDVQWSYRTDPSLVSGFELVAEGYKLSWTGSELLDQVKVAVSSPGPSDD